MKTIRVELGERSYRVLVGAGLLEKVGGLIPSFPHAARAALITDRNVDSRYGDRVRAKIEPALPVETLAVEPGESSKTISTAERLLADLAGKHLRRADPVITLGGGVVCDLGGFVASVYQRGVPLVHLPTTLLAQVDAAIGGKTGVNLAAGKNLAGTFYQPSVVIADVSALATLPEDELRSGLAEVAKYGFCFDPGLLDRIESSLDAIFARDPAVLEDVVSRCVEIKAEITSKDERDQGERVLLNYGHTLAHALESLSGYEGWLHGQAVSVGMVFAAALAQEMGILGDEAVERHLAILRRIGLPVEVSADPDQLVARWGIDKKHRGVPRWVLLKDIGEAVVESRVDEAAVRAALARVIAG